MPLGQLAQVLRDTLGSADERLLVGPETADDGGVVRLGGGGGRPAGTALVQAGEFFPPVVDDAFEYGRVAAANALSDVYAMGGTPLSALTIAGFPKAFPQEWIGEIFRGGFEKIRESGAIVAGGHTVQTPEPLFGFAVTGLVDEREVTANAGARAGDVVFLTKPLGAGSITTGAKRGRVSAPDLRAAVASMATLNDRAAQAMRIASVRAATDVTGFGLVGHACNVARSSDVTVRFALSALPLYAGALELAREGVLSGGSKRGQAALADVVRIAPALEKALVDLVFDAETSGGLLLFVAHENAERLERELTARKVPAHRVGEVVPAQDARVLLEP